MMHEEFPAHFIFFSFSVHAQRIVDTNFQTQKKCLKSLADAPTTPAFPGTLFKKFAGEEVFATHCHLDDERGEFEKFVLLTDAGLKVLKFPVYHYMVEDGKASLPGEITHFRYEHKDYYINPRIGGEA